MSPVTLISIHEKEAIGEHRSHNQVRLAPTHLGSRWSDYGLKKYRPLEPKEHTPAMLIHFNILAHLPKINGVSKQRFDR